MGLKLVSAPTDYPLTVEEAKEHLRVGDDENDWTIELYLKAATQNAEQFLGRALMDQTWDLFLDEFPTEIAIPLPPTIEVMGVFYRDSDGAEQELDEASYDVNDAGDRTLVALVRSGSSWPTTLEAANAVRVRFRAGYLDASSPPLSNVPFDIKAAILLTLGSLYAHRETVVVGQTAVQLPWGAEQLLRPHRVALGMA